MSIAQHILYYATFFTRIVITIIIYKMRKRNNINSHVYNFSYLTPNVIFKHKRWSLKSPHPPFPFRIFCFFTTLATVRTRFFGNNWPAFVATLITCWTFDITWFDSQLFFLWCTPHSPIWKTRGPRTTIAKSFFFIHEWLRCCNDQSQL